MKRLDSLDSQTRTRIEGAARGLVRRASGPVAAWMMMLADLTGDGRDGFVDWMQIDRRDGADIDLGLLRHWLDPTVPFAEQVLGSAHGVAVTSATLKDEAKPQTEAGDAQTSHERLGRRQNAFRGGASCASGLAERTCLTF